MFGTVPEAGDKMTMPTHQELIIVWKRQAAKSATIMQ